MPIKSIDNIQWKLTNSNIENGTYLTKSEAVFLIENTCDVQRVVSFELIENELEISINTETLRIFQTLRSILKVVEIETLNYDYKDPFVILMSLFYREEKRFPELCSNLVYTGGANDFNLKSFKDVAEFLTIFGKTCLLKSFESDNEVSLTVFEMIYLAQTSVFYENAAEVILYLDVEQKICYYEASDDVYEMLKNKLNKISVNDIMR